MAPETAIDAHPKRYPVSRNVLPVVPIASKLYAIELKAAHVCDGIAHRKRCACGLWLAALAAVGISGNCPARLITPE